MKYFYCAMVGLYFVFKNLKGNFQTGYRTAYGYFYFKEIAKSLAKQSPL
jgi:hypothetical protein